MSLNNTKDAREQEINILAEEPTEGQPAAQETQPTQTQPEQDSDIPEKYRNKSLKDLVQMHQELEKLSGRHANELGEIRKLADQLIEAKNAKVSQDEKTPSIDFDESAYWANPKDAIVNTIDKHPSVQEAKKLAAELKQQKAQAALERNHPDYPQIVQDAKFQEWVAKSKVRADLFLRANDQYDADSANELFSMWKERAEYSAIKKAEAEEKNKNAVKSASVGNTSGAAGSQTGIVFYSRKKINELMRNNPREYAKKRLDILQAYAEGRVKP